jgi:transposase
VLGNRRRVRGERGKRLQRRRSELSERSFAHVCETGGARRCWLRGMLQVTKRYLLQVAARNLSLIMRKRFGMGTPRGLQSEGKASLLAYLTHALVAAACMILSRVWNALPSRVVITLTNRRRATSFAPGT